MKTTLAGLVIWLGLALAGSGHAAESGDWISLFNGKDLSGWKSNDETPNVFKVEDGAIKVDGGRAHLFLGENGDAVYKNFEFKAKVMTRLHANSGIYIHTKFEAKGWPSKGYECQVNATHSDRKKTGGLYAVKDVLDQAPNKDDEWFDYYIKVDGRHIVIKINGETTVDWSEPEGWDPAVTLKNMPGRKLSEGTLALQGHDPKSVTFYKDIFIHRLP